MLVALILLAFGHGPIKGFAVVLTLGIITSMFTAITVTRAMVNLMFGGRSSRSCPGMSEPIRVINFMGLRNTVRCSPSPSSLISIVSLATRGLNFGLDFTGGTLVEVEFADR